MIVCIKDKSFPRMFEDELYSDHYFIKGDRVSRYCKSINESTKQLSWTIKVNSYPYSLIYNWEDFVPIEEYREDKIDLIFFS